MFTLLDAVIKIALDDKVTSKIGSINKAVGSGLAKAAKVGAAAVGAVATGLSVMTKAAVENYANYEQLVGGVETLFKDSARTVMQYAESAYNTAGLSANEYMETVTSFSASLLQSLGGDTAKAAEYADMAITDMSDNANKMGSDMSSIQNAYQGFAKQNYTMLDNLKLGYGGTKEEMQRLIDDANKLNETQGKLTNYSIDSYADIVSAIHDVQTEMGITGTTALEASTTISGSVATMKSAWKNMLVGFADDNADFKRLSTNLIDSAMTVFNNVEPRIVTAISGIASFTTQIMPKIIEILSANLPMLLTAGLQIVSALGNAIISNLPMIITAAIGILMQITNYLTENVELLVDGALQIILAISEGLLTNLPTLLSAVGELLALLTASLISHIPDFLMAVAQIIATILLSLQAATSSFSQVAQEWVQGMSQKIADSWSEFLAAGDRALQGLWDGLKQAWASISAWFDSVWNSLFNRSGSLSVSANTGGSGHAGGLDYVPYNEYPARLHRGEAVLTAAEAREWRNGNNGGGAITAIPVEIPLDINLDGRKIAQQTYKFMIEQNRFHGNSLINA